MPHAETRGSQRRASAVKAAIDVACQAVQGTWQGLFEQPETVNYRSGPILFSTI